jgi:hypothetical protein
MLNLMRELLPVLLMPIRVALLSLLMIVRVLLLPVKVAARLLLPVEQSNLLMAVLLVLCLHMLIMLLGLALLQSLMRSRAGTRARRRW